MQEERYAFTLLVTRSFYLKPSWINSFNAPPLLYFTCSERFAFGNTWCAQGLPNWNSLSLTSQKVVFLKKYSTEVWILWKKNLREIVKKILMTFYKRSEKFLSLTKTQFYLRVKPLTGQVSAAGFIVTWPTVLGCSYNRHQSLWEILN